MTVGVDLAKVIFQLHGLQLAAAQVFASCNLNGSMLLRPFLGVRVDVPRS